MSPADADTLLRARGIRPTANRILIAAALAASKRPLSLTELEDGIDTIDKSGIFRTLEVFKEHHLVHAIEDAGVVRYELCRSHGHDRDDDLHPHFYCVKCHKTFCLDGISIPGIPVPEGFTPETVNYIIKGICPQCR